ncbi:MAG: carboxypeptidase-like regulatory domain-containing protein, partial [Flavobacteriales bacterium]
MRKVILLFVLFYVSATQANYDPKTKELKEGVVTGRVIDPSELPMAYASVVIKSQDGTETLSGGITQEDGSFELKALPEGELIVEVQFIGYQTYSQKITISKDQHKVELGAIVLAERANELSGVEVVGERTTIEQKIDRKVINIGKDLTTVGATASDIMNNIPSVNVDQQTGELTLRGNANVRVMVDGKLSNVPVAQLLRQIPSTSIKS